VRLQPVATPTLTPRLRRTRIHQAFARALRFHPHPADVSRGSINYPVAEVWGLRDSNLKRPNHFNGLTSAMGLLRLMTKAPESPERVEPWQRSASAQNPFREKLGQNALLTNWSAL
jgi:hypothetical protein